MFERYSERARQVVFFARFEASVFSSQSIETEHLLLGLARQDRDFRHRFKAGAIEAVREHLKALVPPGAKKIPTNCDLPLSLDCKRALGYAAEESVSFQHGVIGSGHIVLGLLRTGGCSAAAILRENGFEYEQYREFVRLVGVHGEGPSTSALHKPRPEFVIGEKQEIDRPPVAQTAIPALQPVALRLETLVERAAEHLDNQPETDGELRLKHAQMTRQEALGHLVDWATAHHQWFVRALLEPGIVNPGHPAPEWVKAQAYLQFGWQDLVDLWVCMNRLLVHVLAHVPVNKLEAPCRIGVEPPIPLSRLIAGYVDHCEDVMGQILARGSRSNPAE